MLDPQALLEAVRDPEGLIGRTRRIHLAIPHQALCEFFGYNVRMLKTMSAVARAGRRLLRLPMDRRRPPRHRPHRRLRARDRPCVGVHLGTQRAPTRVAPGEGPAGARRGVERTQHRISHGTTRKQLLHDVVRRVSRIHPDTASRSECSPTRCSAARRIRCPTEPKCCCTAMARPGRAFQRRLLTGATALQVAT
jgi:hypothetical protein